MIFQEISLKLLEQRKIDQVAEGLFHSRVVRKCFFVFFQHRQIYMSQIICSTAESG